MVSLGGFILFFGFLAFNGGSQASISADGDAAIVALAIVNTILSGTYITCSLVEHPVSAFATQWKDYTRTIKN